MGLRTKSGKRLTPQSFGELLKKPVYAGRVEVPAWNISCPADFSALIAPETFDRVQLILAGRQQPVSPRLRSNPDFPLRHFVTCGRCEYPITASWSKGRTQRYAYYHCQNKGCRRVRARREDMERKFVTFLAALQPKSEYLRLLGEIVIDVWKRRQAQAAASHALIQKHLDSLRERKNLLVEAFVYKRALDRQTYEEELDRLREEIALAELEESDARLDELDVEATVNFGQHVLLNAARLWEEASSDQKQRLQRLFFPSGVTFADGVYRTRKTSIIFNELEELATRNEGLVALTGIEPVFED